jgi:hypothetical protein
MTKYVPDRRLVRRAATAVLALLLGLCAGCSDDEANAPDPAADDGVRIAVAPTRLSLATGAVQALAIEAVAADGSPLTEPVTLQSSDPSVAVVEGRSVRAIGSGTAQIAVRAGNAEPVSIPVRVAAPISSREAIDAALAAGSIDAPTAIAYRVYAVFGDPRLPLELLGNQEGRGDTRALVEMAAALPTLPAALQADLTPYLLPPIYSDSWLGRRRAAAQPSAVAGRAPDRRALASPDPTCSTIIDPGWTSVDNAHVRVWYDAVRAPGRRNIAVEVLDAAAISWQVLIDQNGARPPLADDTAGPCNGGDGRLDIYLLDNALLPDALGMAPSADTRSGAQPVYILLKADRIAAKAGALRATTTHELSHAIARAYVHGADDSYWTFGEGLADWMATFVWRNRDPDVMPFQNRSTKSLFAAPDVPLFTELGDRGYSTQLLFRVMELTNGAASVFDFLRRMELEPNALLALNDSTERLDAVWHRLVLELWNAAPTDTNGSFMTRDGLEPTAALAREVIVSLGADGTRICTAPRKPIAGASTGDCEADSSSVTMNELSARFERFWFGDPSIRSLTFYNGYTFALDCTAGPCVSHPADGETRAGRALYALIRKAGGNWELQDWTERRRLCLSPAAQQIENIVLVHSNGRFSEVRTESDGATMSQNAIGPIGASPTTLVASEHGCEWDAAAEFSLAANPVDVWTYGWYPQASVGTVLTPFGIPARFDGLEVWRRSYANDLGAPDIVHNPTAALISTVTGLPWNPEPQTHLAYEPGSLVMHPGPESESVLRWTAPFGGKVSVAARFAPLDPGWNRVTVSLLHNGRVIAAGEIANPDRPGSYLRVTGLAVQAGDTVEASIGNGGSFLSDSTSVTFKVSVED